MSGRSALSARMSLVRRTLLVMLPLIPVSHARRGELARCSRSCPDPLGLTLNGSSDTEAPKVSALGSVDLVMADPSPLARSVPRKDVFGGEPIIRGMRISVELVSSLMAQGLTRDDILADSPDLEVEDLLACLAYAQAIIANDSFDNIEVG